MLGYVRIGVKVDLLEIRTSPNLLAQLDGVLLNDNKERMKSWKG